MSSEEWNEYLLWLATVIKEYLPTLSLALLKVLQFSSFRVKAIDTNLDEVRAVHESFYPPEEEQTNWYTPKPNVMDVRREGIKGSQEPPKEQEDHTTDRTEGSEKPFLVQGFPCNRTDEKALYHVSNHLFIAK